MEPIFNETEKQLLKDLASLVNDAYYSKNIWNDPNDDGKLMDVTLYLDKEHFETIMSISQKL